jgi:hypothetical protein
MSSSHRALPQNQVDGRNLTQSDVAVKATEQSSLPLAVPRTELLRGRSRHLQPKVGGLYTAAASARQCNALLISLAPTPTLWYILAARFLHLCNARVCMPYACLM